MKLIIHEHWLRLIYGTGKVGRIVRSTPLNKCVRASKQTPLHADPAEWGRWDGDVEWGESWLRVHMPDMEIGRTLESLLCTSTVSVVQLPLLIFLWGTPYQKRLSMEMLLLLSSVEVIRRSSNRASTLNSPRKVHHQNLWNTKNQWVGFLCFCRFITSASSSSSSSSDS